MSLKEIIKTDNMSNTNLTTLLIFIVIMTTIGVVSIPSEHDLRMEKIQELDAIQEVIRKSDSDIEMLRIRHEIDSLSKLIQNS